MQIATAEELTRARGGCTGLSLPEWSKDHANNLIVDRVDNKVNVDDLRNGASYKVKPPPDVLAEFKMDTSDYSGEIFAQ